MIEDKESDSKDTQDITQNLMTEKEDSIDRYSECSDINISAMVKIEMNVDENEVLNIKSDSEHDSTSSEESLKLVLRKRVLVRNIKKSGFKKKLKKTKKREQNLRLPIFKCIVCDKGFRHHKRYWLHTKEHPNFTCYICWKRFKNLDLLENHSKDHSNQLYVCDESNCDVQYNNYREFILHKKNDHRIENYLTCSECDKTFNSHEKWDIHIQKHIRTCSFSCDKCEKRFSQRASLENHLKLHEESFKCNECDKTYTSIIKLERHRRTHANCFVCEECGRKYNQKYNLKKHIDVTHKGIKAPKRKKTHLCPHCGQTFARPVDLTTHIRTHTGVKPFGCDQCEYRCHDKQLLKSHVRIHSGERPYQCEYCNKSFGSRSYLTVHKRFHTGYRPYICSQCTKGFTNSKDLKVHERTHTGIKLYHCTICSNSFTTLHYLKVHTKKHETQ